MSITITFSIKKETQINQGNPETGKRKSVGDKHEELLQCQNQWRRRGERRHHHRKHQVHAAYQRRTCHTFCKSLRP